MTPILLLGAGRMGGAMLDGWAAAQAFPPRDLLICDPYPGEAAVNAGLAGATINPAPAQLAAAKVVVLAVKPQIWRDVAATYAPYVARDAVLVSIAAGVRTNSLLEAFDRPTARVMPTTAVAIGAGVATVFATADAPREAAHRLFNPLGRVVDVDDEAQIDAATAVSGSGPAYFYAFVEALEAAAVAVGLPVATAQILARQTLIGAAALMAQSGAAPGELRRQVTSKAGTTEAALKILQGDRGLDALLDAAVKAARARAGELAG